MKYSMKYSQRYIPTTLTKKDKKKQYNMLRKSSRLYHKSKYFTRKKLKSFTSKVSPHIIRARKIYGISKITASNKLAKKSGCSISTLRKIVKKGQGAYYSSGSRPNQTPHSWGRARLASAITGGKSSVIDYTLLESGCTKNSKALKLAHKSIPRQRTYTGGNKKFPMHEKILFFQKGPFPKKYTAKIQNKKNKSTRILHFGDRRYEQYKDRTNLGIYTQKNHGNKRRQENYYNRHSGIKHRKKAIHKEKIKSKGYYTPKLLSHIYLW